MKAPGKPLSIGNIKTALQLAEKLVALSPDSPYDWYIYGCIALEARPCRAREAFTKCLSLPEDPKIRGWTGRPKNLPVRIEQVKKMT